MIKLIASDVDGTLVKDSSPFIGKEVPEMILKLKKEKDIQFTVASGRTYYSIFNMFHSVADEIAYIAENGAHIVYQGKTVFLKEMKRKDAEDIIMEYRKYSDCCECVVSTPDGTLLETDDREFIELIRNGYRNKYTLVEDVLATKLPIIKIAIYQKTGIRQLADHVFLPKFADRVKGTIAGEEWVDFMDQSVDKGEALRFLQEYLGVKREETMAFGDNNNDIGMLRQAAESYAVDNARDEVKINAKYVCPGYRENGVYQIISKLL